MSWAERRQRELDQARAARAQREAAVLRRVSTRGVTLQELHDRLILASVLTAGATLDVTRRALRDLAERGEVHERDGVWYPGLGPTPPQGSRVGAPAPGGGERTSSPTPGATAGPTPSAVPSETPPPTPSGHGSDEEGTTREVRPTSPAAPTAGDTPSSSGELDAARAEARITTAAPAGETEGRCATAVGAPSEPAPPPPEPTMRHPEILEYVRQHPGQTVAEVAAALGLDQATLRGRLRRNGAAIGVEIRAAGPRAGTSGPAKPHRLFLSSSPSPSSPPGEAAPASGGDLPTEQQAGAALRDRIARLEDDVVGLADAAARVPELELQVRELQAEGRQLFDERDEARAQLAEAAARAQRAEQERDEAHADRERLRDHLVRAQVTGQRVRALEIELEVRTQERDDTRRELRSQHDARAERDRALAELSEVYAALWPGGDDHAPPPGWVDAAVRRIREPLEALFGPGRETWGDADGPKALTLPSLADEVERLVGELRAEREGLRQELDRARRVVHVGVDFAVSPTADLLDELRARAEASGIRGPRSGGHAALVAHLLGWLEASGVITAPTPVTVINGERRPASEEAPCGS